MTSTEAGGLQINRGKLVGERSLAALLSRRSLDPGVLMQRMLGPVEHAVTLEQLDGEVIAPPPIQRPAARVRPDVEALTRAALEENDVKALRKLAVRPRARALIAEAALPWDGEVRLELVELLSKAGGLPPPLRRTLRETLEAAVREDDTERAKSILKTKPKLDGLLSMARSAKMVSMLVRHGANPRVGRPLLALIRRPYPSIDEVGRALIKAGARADRSTLRALEVVMRDKVFAGWCQPFHAFLASRAR